MDASEHEHEAVPTIGIENNKNGLWIVGRQGIRWDVVKSILLRMACTR